MAFESAGYPDRPAQSLSVKVVSVDEQGRRNHGGRRVGPLIPPDRAALGTLEMVGRGVPKPVRPTGAVAATVTLPDSQFDIGDFIAPALTEENGVLARFGPPMRIRMDGRFRWWSSRNRRWLWSLFLSTVRQVV